VPPLEVKGHKVLPDHYEGHQDEAGEGDVGEQAPLPALLADARLLCTTSRDALLRLT
jgi:hypothetical protein